MHLAWYHARIGLAPRPGTIHGLTCCCAHQQLQSLQDARFTLTGTAKPLSEGDKAAAREVFLAKYPNAFYVDFGDFRWFRVDDLKGGRYVGGFGRVASVRETLGTANPHYVVQLTRIISCI